MIERSLSPKMGFPKISMHPPKILYSICFIQRLHSHLSSHSKKEANMLEARILLQNRYEIIQPIGSGGMGAVYLARDQRLSNNVALKETFFNDAMMVVAFEREARLLAGLRHAALPKVIDHFVDENGQFLVMEFIPGDDLENLLVGSSQSFQIEEMLQWADQLLDALDYLHSQDPPVIHRDIKPQNLKLTSRNQIVLLDFGLAKNAMGSSSTTTSGKSLFAYTPIYAPLEQIQGAGTDSRSDLYSLGATLYHLLTGEKPVDALTRAGDFLNGKPDPLVPAHLRNPRISQSVGEVIGQSMALNRDLRPVSAIEMRKRLRDAIQTPDENTGTQGKTILSQTKAMHANSEKSGAYDATRVAAGQPQTKGQILPKTSANIARQSATHQRPATPKYAAANNAEQSPWATTPAWSSPHTQLHTSQNSGKGKWLAVAFLGVVIVALITMRFTGNSFTEAGSPTDTPPVVEQQKVNTPTDGAAQSPAPASQPQYQPNSTSPMVMPERVSTQETPAQQASEEKPAVADPVASQPAEPVATKQEPAKTEAPQTQPTQQPQQGGRPNEPMRDDRRPPPPHMRPPHEGPPPPPPHGGPPPPDRRRP
jgi:serine/threonine protein kinase